MKTKKKIVLNMGCGDTRIPNSVGVDKVRIDGYVDKVHDLNKVPYPFKTGFADEIHLYHVLEHLSNPLQKMEEFHRLLKPKGKLFIRVPHFSSMGSFTDITHVRPFGYMSFDCFEQSSNHYFYSKVRFKILKRKIYYYQYSFDGGTYEKYIHPPKVSHVAKYVIKLMDFLINASPILFERFWCYWVGGASEIYLELEKR